MGVIELHFNSEFSVASLIQKGLQIMSVLLAEFCKWDSSTHQESLQGEFNRLTEQKVVRHKCSIGVFSPNGYSCLSEIIPVSPHAERCSSIAHFAHLTPAATGAFAVSAANEKCVRVDRIVRQFHSLHLALMCLPEPFCRLFRSSIFALNTKSSLIFTIRSLLKLPARFTSTVLSDFSGLIVFISTKSLPNLPSEPCANGLCLLMPYLASP